MKLAKSIPIDIDKLIGHRLLIQAASGGGKSWLLRLLCEQVAPKVQTLVIDPEGEFSSLRERLDLVLVGAGGEVPADPKNAKALARKLLELRTSAVIDLYELSHERRHAFVRDFIDALMGAPRSLWRPMLVAIDEAHAYAPERGQGESVASGAIIDLLSRGRKRGFAGVLATQRLSKLHKSAAAECGNLIFGRTSPIDQERAADLLGIPRKEKGELSRLDVGEWYGVGPMFDSVDPLRFHADRPQTRHPEAGKARQSAPPAPSKAIQAVASELVDLANRTDDAPLTIEEAVETIKRLKREARAMKPVAASADIGPKIEAAVSRERNRLAGEAAKRDREWTKVADALKGRLAQVADGATKLAEIASRNGVAMPAPIAPLAATTPAERRTASSSLAIAREIVEQSSERLGLSRVETAILTVLAQHSAGMSKGAICIYAGYRPSGDVSSAFARLASEGWTARTADGVKITEAGVAALGPYEPLPTGAELREYWLGRVSPLERALLARLFELHPDGDSKGAIVEAVGYKPSGDVSSAWAKFNRLGWTQRTANGVKAASFWFEE